MKRGSPMTVSLTNVWVPASGEAKKKYSSDK